MPEIIIRQIGFGADGGPANLDRGIELPIDNETLDRTMMSMHVKYPYIAHSYTFGLNELNGQITGPQPLDKLNSLAAMLTDLSEYERVKLEGAVLLTDCKTPEDCVKLMHNLDSFELTPNVSDYDALGRHFAANDFADSLSAVPQDMMEHFDYDLLGRMGWDDSTNVFINGHHIKDTEHELREPDLRADPLACFMKMRLCSENNPDGVWIKFPLSGTELMDTPELGDEMRVALASLKVDSLEECRAAECVSQYPTLTKCFDAHAGEPLEQLLWKAQNLGFAESELGQFGSEQNCAKFAAALEYEGCSNLDFAADISQNLRCYDFAPNTEAYAEKHLLAKGVDSILTGCFDLKTLGNTLAADNGAIVTAGGVISRNEQDFIFDFYQPPKQETEIRLFCPLEVQTDPDSIRYADPNVSAQVWTLTTGSDGKIVIDLPHEGTLIVEELEAPAGYVIGQIHTWEVVVAKGEHKVVDISNDKKADIIVYKKDAQTGQLLSGATIKATLLRSHTTPYESGMVYTATTGADGKAVFSNMIPGEYRIEEQSPPQYYLGTSVVYTVSVYDGSNEPVSVTFENEPWTGLTIKKVDATDGRGLQGAVFKLYEGTAAETSKFLGDFQTNENGLVIIQNLESNKYYTIVEAQPPYGYFLDAEHNVQTILIKPESIDKNITVVFRNMPKPKLLITKIDEVTGSRLPGAVFRVAERGSAEYVEVTTGADGTVLLENMEQTWYQVTEIRSPSGYLLDDTVHDIELISGETAKLVVNNSRQPTLVIEKIDEKTGLPLSGAVFRVAPRDGGDYVEVTTDTYGTAVVNGLSDVWYTVTEVRSPTGYVLDDTPKTVELQPGKTTTIKISNYKKPGLTIKKIDEPKGTSGKYLSENPLVVSGIAMTHENAWTAYNDTPASSEQSAASLNGRGEIPVTLSHQQRLFG